MYIDTLAKGAPLISRLKAFDFDKSMIHIGMLFGGDGDGNFILASDSFVVSGV